MGIVCSQRRLNSTPGHDSRSIPVLVRVASMSLEPESAYRVGPVFRGLLAAKRPRQNTKVVHSTEIVRGPKHHHVSRAGSTLESVEVQDLRCVGLFLVGAVGEREVSAFVAEGAVNLVKSKLVAAIPAPIAQIPPAFHHDPKVRLVVTPSGGIPSA